MRNLHGWAGRLVEEWGVDAAPVAAPDGIAGDGMAGREGGAPDRQGNEPTPA
ncbi:hypothetical protein ACHMW5_06865 (plasmid) [Azospirillum melinis]|uniref:hypothetical protein n=1 Tax=Azospirillum melinis TaxID=328839 RepID=UPI0037563887